MTELVAAEARKVARTETEIIATNPAASPPAIQGAADGAAALPHLRLTFDEMMEREAIDAVIIACFDDTGLSELRTKSDVPVVGIGEAAYHAAMLLAPTFSVVTTLPVSVPVLEDNIEAYGFSSRCMRVRAADVPVLELEADPDGAKSKIETQVAAALAEDEAGAIVLGCAGMAELAVKLQRQFNVRVIDGVKAAVGLSEMLGNTNGTGG